MRAWQARFLGAISPDGAVLVRSVGWVFGAQSLTLLFGFAASAVVARSLGPASQGLFSIALLIPTVLVLITSGGLYAANVYYAGARTISLQDLISNSVFVSILGPSVAAIVLAVAWFGGLLSTLLPGLTFTYLAVAIAILAAQVMRQSATGLILGLQQIPQASRVDMAYASVYLIGTIAFVLVLHGNVFGALAAYLIGVVAAALIALRTLTRAGLRVVPRPRLSTLRATLAFGYRGSAGMVLQFFTYRLDLVFVNLLLGASIAGQYSVASRLAELMWLIPGAVGTVIFTRTAADKQATLTETTPRAFWGTAWIGVACAAMLFVIGPAAIPLLFSSSFAEAFVPMALLLPGAVLLGSSIVLANDLVGRGRPGLVSIATLVTFLVTVLLDVVLIPRFGVVGAAVASSIAYTSYCVMVVALFLWATRMSARDFFRRSVFLRAAT